MKAHLRNNGVNPDGWKPSEILGSFVLLPEPRHNYEEWKLLVYGEEEPQKTKEQINEESLEKLKQMGWVNNG